MLKKVVLVMVLILGLSLVFPAAAAICLPSGKPAPPFAIKSGEDQKLTLNMVLGKVVVLFYEDRKAVDKNDELKGELIRLYRRQPASVRQEIYRLGVIDCSKASFPGKSIWKKKLAEHSRSLGLTIYGDWNRQMLRDYQLRKNDSNFVIIDQNGLIRYSAAGKIRNGQFQQIKALLTSLVQGN
jgi:hypothetical protein